MVQIIPYKGHAGYLAESLGQALGEGLGSFTGSYFANKAIEKTMNDPALKNAPLSERQSRLQQALAPYGQRGERMLERRLQIEQQAQQENLFKKARELSNSNAPASEIAMALYEAGGPKSAPMVPQLTKMILDQRQANPPDVTGGAPVQEERMPEAESPYLRPAGKGIAGTGPQVSTAGQPAPRAQPAPSAQVPPQQEPMYKEDYVQDLAKTLGESYFPTPKAPQPLGPGETRYPTKPPLPPKPIGPNEERTMRRQLHARGIRDKSEQDEYIQATKQYQTDTYNAEKLGYSSVKEYNQDRVEEDARFMKEIQPTLEAQYGSMTPGQLNVWKGISRLFENSGSDEARYRNTQQVYDQMVFEPLRSFAENARPLPFGSAFRPEQIRESLDENRSLVQEHLKKIDSQEAKQIIPDEDLRGEIKNLLRDQYMTQMASKDWGVAQAAYTVSNLDQKTRMSIPVAKKPYQGFFETVYYGGNPEEKKKAIGSLAMSLRKLKPDDSLILAREQAIANNYDDAGFNEALRIALTDPNFKLSPYQLMERPRLSVPQRLDLDSIMNNKRSLFDTIRRKE